MKSSHSHYSLIPNEHALDAESASLERPTGAKTRWKEVLIVVLLSIVLSLAAVLVKQQFKAGYDWGYRKSRSWLGFITTANVGELLLT